MAFTVTYICIIILSFTLLSILTQVNAQQVEMDKKFGAVHRAFAMLDKFSHPLPKKLIDQFNTAPHRSTLCNQSCTKIIYPHIHIHVGGLILRREYHLVNREWDHTFSPRVRPSQQTSHILPIGILLYTNKSSFSQNV